MTYDATLVYEEDWATKLQERLDYATVWKDICRVDYTNGRVLHNPYLTDPNIQTLNRGTAYTMQPISETDESVTISSGKIIAQFIDQADLAQSGYTQQMALADAQGVLLNEGIESALYANHAAWTDFGSEDVAGTSTGGTSQITVSDTNIDDIILALDQTIRTNNGQQMMARNGAFIVWRPGDFQLLKGFMMANGFASADLALKNGVDEGVNYMGFTHYVSNLLTANHVFAGVKKAPYIGICKDTYGQIKITQDPGLVSGIGIISRVDYALKAWTKVKPVIYDVNVA